MLDLLKLLNTRSAYAGRWDAAGDRLYFVSDLDGVPQVWSVSGAPEPRRELAPPDRAQTVHPGPLPGQVVVGVDEGGDEHTQLMYRASDGAAWTAWTSDRLWIHNFGSWSPDGQQAAYASNERTGRWFDVYVRDVGNGQTRCVLKDDSTNEAGPFSPDGRWLLMRRVHSNVEHELWLVDLTEADTPRRITPEDELAAYECPHWTSDGRGILCITDYQRDGLAVARIDITSPSISYLVTSDHEIDALAVSTDGRRLAYALNQDGAARLMVRDLRDGSEQSVEGLPEGALYEYFQRGLAWDPSGTRLAICWTASLQNANVWEYNAQLQALTQLTFAPAEGCEAERLVQPEHVSFPSFDQLQIPAFYYRAPSAGAEPPPCVVWVHGGPESQFRPTFQPLVQYLVSAGFAVLATNVRGSSGYGKQFLALDDVRKRMDSVADLAAAVGWLEVSGRAAPKRIAVYGGSYGGFMVLAALATYPDLWAAGVDLVGIANFVTFLENTGPWRRHLREREYGSLENDRDFLTEISPINHVERIRAPLLVIHGANDSRVPIGETEQMVQRLRELGRPVQLLRMDDEGHQISKLKNKLTAYPLAVQFLADHLGSSGTETVAPEA